MPQELMGDRILSGDKPYVRGLERGRRRSAHLTAGSHYIPLGRAEDEAPGHLTDNSHTLLDLGLIHDVMVDSGIEPAISSDAENLALGRRLDEQHHV
jgi:hypothetical protein